MHHCLVHLVIEVDDKVWMKEMFGETLRALRSRVPDSEEEWEFGEQIGECLGEQDDEKKED